MFFHHLREADVAQAYAFALGCIVFGFFVVALVKDIIAFTRDHRPNFLRRHFLYSVLFRDLRFVSPVSRYHFSVWLLYCGGTVACNIIGVHNVNQASSRAGILAIITMVPLFLSTHHSLGSHLMGMSVLSYGRIHGVVGRMAFVQSVVHVILALHGRSLAADQPGQLFGLLVSPFLIMNVI